MVSLLIMGEGYSLVWTFYSYSVCPVDTKREKCPPNIGQTTSSIIEGFSVEIAYSSHRNLSEKFLYSI